MGIAGLVLTAGMFTAAAAVSLAQDGKAKNVHVMPRGAETGGSGIGTIRRDVTSPVLSVPEF